MRGNPKAHRRATRRRAEEDGRRAETFAALYLRLKGYRIIATRYRTRVGEIDLVARRGPTLVFVEVKRRSGAGPAALAGALEAVNARRIAQAAEGFRSARPEFASFDCRFDVIVLAPARLPYHLEDAFRAP
ncbi:YraN family protein [Pelagibacterium montanilacus]|uniref:YraN family protein n=1 Tax=Pelagibacterium montanilacus TaxID=2185280 RepID=UPI000F8D3C77|nr:YraN family protein [Pelagibacterium montanilacus]